MAGQRTYPEYTPAQALEICERLKAENGYHLVVPKGDSEYLVLTPLMFHWTLMRGLLFTPEFLEERWCYKTGELGLQALIQWAATGYQGEPQGWHRHPSTGRRRPEGNQQEEYVEW